MKMIWSIEYEPHEQREVEAYIKGPEVKAKIQEFDCWLRDQIKYHDRTELERARKELWDCLDGMDLYE